MEATGTQVEAGAVVVIISADAEWRAVKRLFPQADFQPSPYGEWFVSPSGAATGEQPGPPSAMRRACVFFHGGWGKISAAAATQYAIDRWRPALLINLGTCGGFYGAIQRGAILLVEKTIVYDIIEQMGDFDAHIEHYTTELDLSWLAEPFPLPVQRSLLLSGDRDLLSQEIPYLAERYGALAGDWESGAIAFVAARNRVRTLILRGVSDLVGGAGSQAYGDLAYFERQATEIMKTLLDSLPGWLERAGVA